MVVSPIFCYILLLRSLQSLSSFIAISHWIAACEGWGSTRNLVITLCLQTAQGIWFPKAPVRSVENPTFSRPALKICGLIALKRFHCFLTHGAFHNASSGIPEIFTCLTGSGIIWDLEIRTIMLLPHLEQNGLTREMQQTAYLAAWANAKSSPWHSGLTSSSLG